MSLENTETCFKEPKVEASVRDRCNPYGSLLVQAPAPLAVPASCLCRTWEATGDHSGVWMPATYVGDLE